MRRWLRLFTVPVLIIVVLGVIAGTSVVGSLSGSSVIMVAGAGSIVAALATTAGQRVGLLTAEWVALSLILFFLGGGFVGSGEFVPDPLAFFDSLVAAWADLLSSVPPVPADSHYLVVPYTLAWLGTTGGLVLGRHVRVPAFAALAPLAAFAVGLLFSVELRTTALIQGGLLLAGSLTLGWFQQRDFGFETDMSLGATTVERKRARVAQAGALLAVVAMAAPTLAPHVPGFDDRPRFDLRDRLEPPWNPLEEPSPLAQLKDNYVDDAKGDVAFVLHGENIPARWRVASLGVFDGTVWTVADTAADGLAPFRPIDGLLPADPQWTQTDAAPAVENVYSVEVRNADAPWLPLPADPVRIDVTTGDDDLRFNEFTRTAALPGGAQGSVYDVTARPAEEYSDLVLRDATFPFPQSLGVSQQARVVRNWSADLVEGEDRGWLQVEAVREDLISTGFYLATDEARPGHSWARLTDFFSGEQMYGFEEQYAAAAAVAVRNADLSARVVVGYVIDPSRLGGESVEVRRGEASAWIEVLTAEYGWVPVDVTPDRNKTPTIRPPEFRTETVAAPNPPPPPPPPSDVEIEPEDLRIDRDEEEEEEEVAPSRTPAVTILGGAAALPFTLAGLAAAMIVGRKARRRRRRERDPVASRRISGAWYEANDRLAEIGLGGGRRDSVAERAAGVPLEPSTVAAMCGLASSVDRAAFGRQEPTPADAENAWRLYDEIKQGLDSNSTVFQRIGRLLSRAPFKAEVRSR